MWDGLPNYHLLHHLPVFANSSLSPQLFSIQPSDGEENQVLHVGGRGFSPRGFWARLGRGEWLMWVPLARHGRGAWVPWVPLARLGRGACILWVPLARLGRGVWLPWVLLARFGKGAWLLWVCWSDLEEVRGSRGFCWPELSHRQLTLCHP